MIVFISGGTISAPFIGVLLLRCLISGSGVEKMTSITCFHHISSCDCSILLLLLLICSLNLLLAFLFFSSSSTRLVLALWHGIQFCHCHYHLLPVISPLDKAQNSHCCTYSFPPTLLQQLLL